MNELVKWDYDKSVAWMRPKIRNFTKQWDEIEPELKKARSELTGERERTATGTFVPMDKTWAQYCQDIGITKQHADRLLKEPKEKKDTKKEPEQGDYKTNILLYDSMMEDVVSNIGPFDLIIADPPYNVTSWDWDQIQDYLKKSREWLSLCKKILKDQYNLFWFCSPKYSADIEMIFRELDLPIQSRIVWHRRNMAMGSDSKNKFIDTWEMIFHAGNRQLNFSKDWDDKRFDVQTHAVPQTNFTDTKYHPTQKPLELIKILVEAGSYDGDDVLDPFAGSGTTAATGLNRNFTLIEKELEHVATINKRFGL